MRSLSLSIKFITLFSTISVGISLSLSQMNPILSVLPSSFSEAGLRICLLSLYASRICLFALLRFTACLKCLFPTLTIIIIRGASAVLSWIIYTNLTGNAAIERLFPPPKSV